MLKVFFNAVTPEIISYMVIKRIFSLIQSLLKNYMTTKLLYSFSRGSTVYQCFFVF